MRQDGPNQMSQLTPGNILTGDKEPSFFHVVSLSQSRPSRTSRTSRPFLSPLSLRVVFDGHRRLLIPTLAITNAFIFPLVYLLLFSCDFRWLLIESGPSRNTSASTAEEESYYLPTLPEEQQQSSIVISKLSLDLSVGMGDPSLLCLEQWKPFFLVPPAHRWRSQQPSHPPLSLVQRSNRILTPPLFPFRG